MVTRSPGCKSSVPAPEAMTAPGIVFASATERLISSLADDHGKPIPRCEVSIASATARPSDHTWRRKASVASQSSATASVGSILASGSATTWTAAMPTRLLIGPGAPVIGVWHPDTNEVLGGITGRTSLGLLFIDLVFLPDNLRGDGLGSRILKLAEDEGRRRGCRAAMLYTISFQAPGFYARHGWRVFGEIACDPPGTSRIFMTKSL